MLDGSSGSLCNYTITYTENIYDPVFANDLDGGEAIPYTVCQGASALGVEVYPPIDLAHGYYWVPSWSGDTIISTISSTTIDVPDNIDIGVHEICVSAFSGCDLSNTVCFEVNIVESLSGERDPIILCPEEFPITWGNLTIDEAGVYQRSYSIAGCDLDTVWEVESYPVPDFVIIDTMHCLPLGEFSFYYESEAYDQGGVYPLFYAKADVNGCDSLAELDLSMIGLDAYTEISCNNAQFNITAFIEEVMPFISDIEFYWYQHGTTNLVSEDNPFVTTTPGCYDLFIHVVTSEYSCEYFLGNHCIDGAGYFPPSPELPFEDTLICRNQVTSFCVPPDSVPGLVTGYIWTAPSGVLILQNGLACTEMDFSGSAGGQVCVQAIGNCGGGSPACFDVALIPSPIANFTSNTPVCVKDTVVFTFAGVASPLATFSWDFGSPEYISGIGSGPYDVVWSDPGLHSVALTVIEAGCDTASYTTTISVEQLSLPVVNCITTINSILFDWQDIPGVNGYLVSLNGGPTVPVSGTDTLLNMISAGSSVDLILTSVSTGPCPNTIDTITCIAQNCPSPMIELTGQDSICLNLPIVIDLQALVNGIPGNGLWSGTGITDNAEGLFDPATAGPGLHVLTYTLVENECVFNLPYSITVFDSITADFIVDPSACITDTAQLTYLGNASANATYHLSFDSAAIHQGSDAGPYFLSWDHSGQKTITLQVEENGCISDVISNTIFIGDTLLIPIVHCVQSLDGVAFMWETDPAATGYMYNAISGQPGILNGNTYTFNGLNEGDLVRLEIISQTVGPCPERRDTFECVAKDCPDVILTISDVDDLCLYPDVENIHLEVGVSNGNGSGVWNGVGITDPAIGIFNPHMAGVGTHMLSYQYTDQECDFFETITIDVFDVPQAIISNTQLIITCASGSLFLDGSQSSGNVLTYEWTTHDGAIAGGALTSIAEVTQAGIYQLQVSNPNTGCKDSISVTVEQDSAIPVADAGIDKIVTCDSVIVNLGGHSTTGSSIIYSWSTSDGNLLGQVNANQAVADQPGTYSISVRDTVTGCQSFDEVLVGIDTSVATILLDPGDTIDCNTPVSVLQSTLSEPLVDYSFEWTTLDGLIIGNHEDSSVNVGREGRYTLSIHNLRNGCESSGSIMAIASDEIIEGLIIDQKDITCFGFNNGSITIVDIIGGVPDYTYDWSTQLDGSPTITSLAVGNYSITVTDDNGCSFIQEFEIAEPEVVTIDLGPDRIVEEGDSVSIMLETNLMGNSISSIEWSEYAGITCPGCTTFEFKAVSDAVISASITDLAGCSASDSMRLSVYIPHDWFAPNIFSPNDDGLNDYFTIYGRSNLTNIISLRIFDRWGNQVFEKFDLKPGMPQAGWDGRFRDEQMQSGVYIFVAEVEFEGITEMINGNITLIR